MRTSNNYESDSRNCYTKNRHPQNGSHRSIYFVIFGPPSELIFQCYPLNYMDHHYTEVNCNRKVDYGTIFKRMECTGDRYKNLFNRIL